MPDPGPFVDRLKKGLVRIDQNPPQGGDAEATVPLRRSLERTIARLERGSPSGKDAFRFQLTGGKPILLQGQEALPLEPARLIQLLNAIQVELQPGEFLDLDGALAALLIHPEVNLTDTQLRRADTSLRSLKSGYDRDHAAAQSAESTKIRLRSRLTQLVSALQHAQSDRAEAPHAAPPGRAPEPPPTVPSPPAPAPPPSAPDAPAPSEETLVRALRKIQAALDGLGYKFAATGALGHRAWVHHHPVTRLDFLLSASGPGREALFSAARGEGLDQAPGQGPLRLKGSDGKGTVELDFREASGPYPKEVLSRAELRPVLGVEIHVARCEDLILYWSSADLPGSADRIVELLRVCAGSIDAAYLKKQAEAAGVFDRLKECWKRAKEPA